MITNERAYRITKAQADKFREAIEKAKASPPAKNVHAKLHQASINAMRSQLKTLEDELRAYDGLKKASGKRRFEGHFEELPLLLTQARISRGWTQKELAERLGLQEQKIQQYESGGYDVASLTRINEVLTALGARGTCALALVQLPADIPPLKSKGNAMLSHQEQITYGEGWVESEIHTIAVELGQQIHEVSRRDDDGTYLMVTRLDRGPANVDVSDSELEDLHSTAQTRRVIRERIRQALIQRR